LGTRLLLNFEFDYGVNLGSHFEVKLTWL